ncbi:hypothetical protein DSO57_1035738 [Entomophthora muscae]|uniref:Uncharacterized protein n=1 Tax=Entomophthora muscae TaxID=34485 RepID=A0ACC2U921_9FUNG|nr:hypothetical protein DSO57_1035738 [Entomophthora muscae]
MNHLICTAVLTACLGIGGYQHGSEFFGPSSEGLGHDHHYEPGQLNSSHTGSWPPLVSPHFTLFIVVYTSMYYVLTYFAGSFGRYNIHTKVFHWLMTIYPIVTALTGFQFSNLLSYLLQVAPIVSGYYTFHKDTWCQHPAFKPHTDMEAPPTLKPDCLHPTPGLTPPTATQYAGIAYITLDGLVDTMVLAAGPWALVDQSASYLIKLAPLLWWALPSTQQSKLVAEANSPFPGTRYPDRHLK